MSAGNGGIETVFKSTLFISDSAWEVDKRNKTKRAVRKGASGTNTNTIESAVSLVLVRFPLPDCVLGLV